MSGNNFQSSFSSTSYSSSSFSSSSGGASNFRSESYSSHQDSSGARQTLHTTSDPRGTVIRESNQLPGEASATSTTTRLGPDGRPELESGSGSGGGADRKRIEDVTDKDDVDEAQAARDREYEERMEDEYAKREGGA